MTKTWVTIVILQKNLRKQVLTSHGWMDNKMIMWRQKLTLDIDIIFTPFWIHIQCCWPQITIRYNEILFTSFYFCSNGALILITQSWCWATTPLLFFWEMVLLIIPESLVRSLCRPVILFQLLKDCTTYQ